jgi:ABC-type multidrug transport system fused ATPase/permease subunit
VCVCVSNEILLYFVIFYQFKKNANYLFHISPGSRGNYNIRVKLHRNLLLQEASFFDSTETGVLLSRLNNDVNKIGMVISFHVNVVFRQFAQLIFGAVYLFKISRSLAIAAFGGIGLVTILSAIYGEFSRILAERLQNMFAESTAVAETSFSMSETVRAFDGFESEVEKYESSQSRALDLEEVQAWAYGSHKFISDSLQTALQGLLLFACWTMGRTQELPLEKLTTFMFYVNFVLESSNEVGDQWAKIQSAIGASNNVFELIRRVPAIRDPKVLEAKETIDKKNGVNGHVRDSNEPIIHIENMSVSYGFLEVPALNNISLDIYEGDKVAIVGRSGSGKSSLLRTLLRFYDPTSGKCELLGKNLKKWTRREHASTMTVVEQEPHLFPMTLFENVLYGIQKDSINKDGEKIYSDAWRRDVSVALDVAGLPVDGAQKNNLGLELDTRVGEGGRTLSGGQRQVSSTEIQSLLLYLCDSITLTLRNTDLQ